MKTSGQLLDETRKMMTNEEREQLLAAREKYARGLELVAEALNAGWNTNLLHDDTDTKVIIVRPDCDEEEDVGFLGDVYVERDERGRAVNFAFVFQTGVCADPAEVEWQQLGYECEMDYLLAMASRPHLTIVPREAPVDSQADSD